MQYIREDPERSFFCLDWDDEDPITLFGSFGTTSTTSTFKMLDFNVMPCNARHTEFNPEGVFTVSEDCITDHKKQIEYLGKVPVLHVL